MHALLGLEKGAATPSLELFEKYIHPSDRAQLSHLPRLCEEQGGAHQTVVRLMEPEGAGRVLLIEGKLQDRWLESKVSSAYLPQTVVADQAQTLLEQIGAPLLVFSGIRLLYANPAAEALLQFPFEKLTQLPLWISKEQQDALFETQDTKLDLRVHAGSGEPLSLRAQIGEIEWDQAPARLVTLENRSEIEQASLLIEAAQAQGAQAETAKRRFLSNISHEVRSPLNGVIGMASLLANQPLEPVQSEMVKSISQSGDRLLVLLNQIIEFAEMDGNLPAPIREIYASDALIQSLEVLAQSYLGKSDVTFVARRDQYLPPRLRGDQGRLTSLLGELIKNAIKFSKSGEITLDLWLDLSGPIPELIAQVDDFGIGIPEDQLERIFDPFYQVDSALNRRYEGAGLGLALCKAWARAMDAKIWAEPQEQGSRFMLRLPIKLD